MSKVEIMAELARLSREDLADIRAWIDRVAPDRVGAPIRGTAGLAARVRTPRLADPARAGDFAKRVTELPDDAAI